MLNLRRCGPNADPDRFARRCCLQRSIWAACTAVILLTGCANMATPPAQTAAPAPPVVTPVPFADAVVNAATAVFKTASENVPPGGQRQVVVIDPLVNGVTGEQSAATQQIQERIIALAKANYPQFD